MTSFTVNFGSDREKHEWNFRSDGSGTVFNVTSRVLHFLVDRFRWEVSRGQVLVSIGGKIFVAEPVVHLAHEKWLSELITGSSEPNFRDNRGPVL